MDKKMKDLNKVLSGDIITKIGEDIMITRQSSARERYLADFFSYQVYEQAFKEGVFVQEEIELIAIENGWWTEEKEEELKNIPKDIEQMRVDYYNNFIRDNAKLLIKKAINKKEERYKKLISEKYELYSYTCESLQTQAYEMELLRRCTSFLYDEQSSIDRLDMNLLQSRYNKEILSDKELRELSKDNEWKSIWAASKDGRQIFSVETCDLSEMQRALIGWSRMYDNIYESMETPSEDIINDDIAIDGWFALQSRKREDEQKKSQADGLPESAEVFVPVSNKKEAQRVHDMNDLAGKRQISSRMKDLKERGSLEEGDFSHVRQDIQMKSNQAVFQHYK